MKPYLAEFLGTMILVLLGDGVVANALLARSKGENAGWIVITTGWGVAVAIAVYSVGRISGAHLNPAVTLALAAIGSFSWTAVPGYLVAQIAGAFAGAVLVWLVYLPALVMILRRPNVGATVAVNQDSPRSSVS